MARATTRRAALLLFLFRVNGVLAQPGAVFTQLELFAAWLAAHGVVVVAGFFTDQKHGFRFLFTLSHGYLLTGKIAEKRLIPSPNSTLSDPHLIRGRSYN